MNMENAELTLKTTGGKTFVINKLAGFRCRKERYTPYSTLEATVIGGEGVSDVVEAKLSVARYCTGALWTASPLLKAAEKRS